MSECTYTHDEVIRAAEDAVNLFIEYRGVHGFIEQDAKLQALAEVAEIAGYPDEEEAANARLIAAAPDLLTSLKDLVGDLRYTGVFDGGQEERTLLAAEQAIARAEGRE